MHTLCYIRTSDEMQRVGACTHHVTLELGMRHREWGRAHCTILCHIRTCHEMVLKLQSQFSFCFCIRTAIPVSVSIVFLKKEKVVSYSVGV